MRQTWWYRLAADIRTLRAYYPLRFEHGAGLQVLRETWPEASEARARAWDGWNPYLQRYREVGDRVGALEETP